MQCNAMEKMNQG